MVNDHLDSQSIVDVHEEGVDRIMTLGLDGGGVDGGNGTEKCCVVGIFTAALTYGTLWCKSYICHVT